MWISLFDDNYNEMIKSLYFVFFFIFICDDKNIVVLKLIVVKKNVERVVYIVNCWILRYFD